MSACSVQNDGVAVRASESSTQFDWTGRELP